MNTLVRFLTRHGRGKPCTVKELAITKQKLRAVGAMVLMGLACILGGALAAAVGFLVFAL